MTSNLTICRHLDELARILQLRCLGFDNTTTLSENVQKVIDPEYLRNWLRAIKNMFIRSARLAGHDLSGGTVVLVDVGERIRNALTYLYDLVCKAFPRTVHLPHSIWIALTSAVNSVNRGIANALAVTVRTIKTTLFMILILLAAGTVLAIGVQVFPYLVRAYKSLQEAEYRRRERSRLQRTVEEQRRLAKEQFQRQHEAQKRRAHEEHQNLIRAQLRKIGEQQRVKQCLKDWQAESASVLSKKSTMHHFPEPQIDACENCQYQRQQSECLLDLRICKHNLEKLLRSSGRYAELLREEKYKWHPDKFGTTPASTKAEIIRKATSLFQMLGALPQEDSDRNHRPES
jgi:hypothetical protein